MGLARPERTQLTTVLQYFMFVVVAIAQGEAGGKPLHLVVRQQKRRCTCSVCALHIKPSSICASGHEEKGKIKLINRKQWRNKFRSVKNILLDSR